MVKKVLLIAIILIMLPFISACATTVVAAEADPTSNDSNSAIEIDIEKVFQEAVDAKAWEIYTDKIQGIEKEYNLPLGESLTGKRVRFTAQVKSISVSPDSADYIFVRLSFENSAGVSLLKAEAPNPVEKSLEKIGRTVKRGDIVTVEGIFYGSNYFFDRSGMSSVGGTRTICLGLALERIIK
jgi:hypothetical protein